LSPSFEPAPRITDNPELVRAADGSPMLRKSKNGGTVDLVVSVDPLVIEIQAQTGQKAREAASPQSQAPSETGQRVDLSL